MWLAAAGCLPGTGTTNHLYRRTTWCILHPAEISGRFSVVVNDEILFDRKGEGRFPETKELKQLIRDKVAPEKSLGHSDKPTNS